MDEIYISCSGRPTVTMPRRAGPMRRGNGDYSLPEFRVEQRPGYIPFGIKEISGTSAVYRK